MSTELDDSSVSRRDAIKKAAVAGAVVAWGTPVVSAIGSGAAFAQAGPSDCPGCVRIGSFINTIQEDGTLAQVLLIGSAGTCQGAAGVTYAWTNDGTTGGLTFPANDTGSIFDGGDATAATSPATLDFTVTLSVTCTCQYANNGGSYQSVHSCTSSGTGTWQLVGNPQVWSGTGVTATDDCPGGTACN